MIVNIITLLWLHLWPSAQSSQVCLSAEEQKLYHIIQQYRAEKKLPAIPLSTKLTQVAQAHVRDLDAHYTFDKNNACNPHSWSAHGAWSACCYTSDHKQARCMWDKPREIANYNSEGFEIAYYHSVEAAAADALAGWQKSVSHNPLLVNSGMWKEVSWQAIGIGIYKHYAVVWFGRIADDEKPKGCQ